MALSISVFYPFLYFFCLVCFVYVCYTLINRLLYVHLPWLALFATAVCILSAPSASAVPIPMLGLSSLLCQHYC